ncbi:unnamed protein product [Cylicocyclus nassatus]|uniref:Replication protein A OB domain-containing protein n=1 Tax=Cylicocyclus nassatus TaxID=53992 RepID=A0AA36MDX8_CYLNA|nr:unnamed protein product [Cylicocyclus nassatus]
MSIRQRILGNRYKWAAASIDWVFPALFVAASLESQCAADGIVGNSEHGGEIIAVTGLKINRDCYIGKSGAKTSGIPMLVITGYELLSRGHQIFSAGISHAGDKVFSFEFTDKDEVAIRVSAFNDVAERASEIIQLDYTYYINGASVKQANKRFNNTGHDYELIMNASTVIDRCRAGIPKPSLVLKICLLDDVPSHKNENINVLAVVDEFHQVNKRDIHLIDQSSSVVKLTLWGEQADFQDHVLGEVVSIKGARVKEWMGAFSLAVGPLSKIVFSPQMDVALSLSEWYANKRRMADVKSISTASFGRSDGFGTLLLQLTDFTGSIWVSIFSNVAAKMLGMEAEQLAEMKAADHDAYIRLLTSLCFTYFNWRINAKTNTYRDATRMCYSVLLCDAVPSDRYIPLLQQSMNALERL